MLVGPGGFFLSNRPFIYDDTLLVIPTGAERRDLRFRGPFLEMFFDRVERSGAVPGYIDFF
jgi:hypothetical protein